MSIVFNTYLYVTNYSYVSAVRARTRVYERSRYLPVVPVTYKYAHVDTRIIISSLENLHPLCALPLLSLKLNRLWALPPSTKNKNTQRHNLPT
jgi:hypothetical protein